MRPLGQLKHPTLGPVARAMKHSPAQSSYVVMVKGWTIFRCERETTKGAAVTLRLCHLRSHCWYLSLSEPHIHFFILLHHSLRGRRT